ncbi:MAG TPA: hypothetical protein VN721_10010 [Flavipsychrobacter sp.]|nr:hypothetical protein [Flavipsychrobacter sp.]
MELLHEKKFPPTKLIRWSAEIFLCLSTNNIVMSHYDIAEIVCKKYNAEEYISHVRNTIGLILQKLHRDKRLGSLHIENKNAAYYQLPIFFEDGLKTLKQEHRNLLPAGARMRVYI